MGQNDPRHGSFCPVTSLNILGYVTGRRQCIMQTAIETHSYKRTLLRKLSIISSNDNLSMNTEQKTSACLITNTVKTPFSSTTQS